MYPFSCKLSFILFRKKNIPSSPTFICYSSKTGVYRGIPVFLIRGGTWRSFHNALVPVHGGLVPNDLLELSLSHSCGWWTCPWSFPRLTSLFLNISLIL